MSDSLPERLVGGARRRVGRLARRARTGRPSVTVVVELSGAEAQARAAVDSVRDQPLATLEIVLVLVDERLRPLAERSAAEDWRVRRVDAIGADPAAVRRVGSLAARGGRLLFLPPRQLLVPRAVERLLAGAGADETRVVAGEVEGASGSGTGELRTPLLGRLLVPRATWEQVRDDGEPDGQGAAVALLLAPHVSLGTVTLRDEGAVRARLFERVEDPLPGLDARLAHDTAMLALLSDPGARARRAAGALTRDLPRFLLAAERCDDDQWTRLSRHLAALVEAAEGELATVPVEDRVSAWLAARGRRADLEAYVAERRFANGAFATTVREGRVVADLGEDVPEDVRTLTAEETALRTQLRRSRVEGTDLLLEVWAVIRGVEEHDPAVALRLTGAAGELQPAVRLGADAAVTRWAAEPDRRHDRGAVHVRVPLAGLTPGRWRVAVELADRGVRRSGVVADLDATGSAGRRTGSQGLAWEWCRGEDGLELVVEHGEPAPTPGPAVRRVEVTPGRLTARLDVPAGAAAALVAPGQRIAGVRQGDEWTFELVSDPWGLGPRPAPPGTYRLEVDDGRGEVLPLSEEVTSLLPLTAVDDLHRTALWRGPRGGLVLRLDPPLGDDVAGPWAQRRLQRAYATASEPLDPRLVVFQSFLGQSPTDHPAAIQAALRRAGADARVLWCVHDSSVRVPDGAEPVLLRSREWYDALARAQYVVTNIELDPWFRRRDGQEVLETYHGYPSKAMGLSQWRARGLTPSHQRQMLRRTSGAWNTLLTPVPEMDRYYRENYEFDGRIISQGYPRDDALVAEGHQQRREETRTRLGIAPHQQAVLYAPTWRDDLATNFRSAEAVLHLDVEEAARALGPDHVLLMRGHRFHAPSRGGAQVLDVTAYPEINDLILAADAAVLDYSSLRFDFALTGRPMVFLVPDLRSYTHDTRGFLYPFQHSAPGPLVDTTAEVVDLLRDLPALTARWADELASFNATYNRLADGRAAERVVVEFFSPLLRRPSTDAG